MARIYTRNSSPYWWARYHSPDGQEVRRSLKLPKGAKYREAARLKASELEIDHWQAWKAGKLDRPLYTFEELMVGWIEERNPGSADMDNIKVLKEVFGGRIIDQIKGSEIADCKRQWRSKGLSNNTIRRRLSMFSSAISYARAE